MAFIMHLVIASITKLVKFNARICLYLPSFPLLPKRVTFPSLSHISTPLKDEEL
jgi:hypothetical protein